LGLKEKKTKKKKKRREKNLGGKGGTEKKNPKRGKFNFPEVLTSGMENQKKRGGPKKKEGLKKGKKRRGTEESLRR